MRPHDLLRLTTPVRPDGAPDWVGATAWVVVRRATATPGTIPVGVRGPTRSDRFAFALDPAAVEKIVRPEDLAARTGMPALDQARAVLDPTGWVWGPTGSAGFELATGRPTVAATSDLDLVIRVHTLPPADELERVHAALPGRADCLIETPAGAIALTELVSGAAEVLLRTPQGPRLVLA